MDEDQLARVRHFNRAVTRRIGVLNDNYLGRGRPLGEARVLFEIGCDGIEVRALRARLALDSGYASRLLRALEAQGLIRCRPDAEDRRVRRATLTAKGRREVDALDRRSQDAAEALLASLGARQRERLVAAMDEVERLMRAAAVTVAQADPSGPEARRCIAAYLDELNRRFENGFDPAQSVSAEPDELAPPAGWFVLAHLDGEAVGCGGLKVHGRDGEIKRMWVAPQARGLGVAQRLLENLEARAAELRLKRLRLDTHCSLVEAHALYRRNGYAEIPAYNDNLYAHHWFEKVIGSGKKRA
ncbi:helix-turn-helix domain-containing GNAT family N-acetyltransferase [Oleiagrimonas sp. MCCC 1A03011]|uniref:bifunctional helix-turn-helix transcriptional regulator/GNAT family N-acetyltransferase n=1 Tax=Oleiagrimonas sp. MCCC 1A03011 TaxID=1926883 RepID=UPI000DC515F1|nr:helix-turn-helix domain-containing GNAT family N-acetyltransferase [Oleiagrimonas sp. MCCC 1A03011]RAP58198.1 MarR family transcriptional regulator [Oleiagrimonas sp. MCCC 1A03011]